MALKVGRMVVFTALATAAGHVFSLSMQSNDPTKLRIFFGISSLPPCFLRWRRVSEEISCLVVESGKCYQRMDGEELSVLLHLS